MCPAPGRELIELRVTACLRRLPVGDEQFFVFEAMESGVKRSLLDLQGIARHLLNPLRDGIAVNGAKRNYPHDEEIEGTLREIEFVFRLHAYGFYIYALTCRRSRCLFLEFVGPVTTASLTRKNGTCIQPLLRPRDCRAQFSNGEIRNLLTTIANRAMRSLTRRECVVGNPD